MKAGWEVKSLAEVCDIKPAKKTAKQRLLDSDLVSFVPMTELAELKSEFQENECKPLHKVYSGYTYFADNDVLIAKITPCFENGKMGIARNMTNGVGFGSSEFVPLRSKGSITPEYLFYYLLRDEFRLNGARVMTGAVGHRRVPKEYFEELQIPLPPLDEQKRIVAVLDAAFDGLARARANVEANLQNARELFESYLEKFGHEKKPLGGFVKIRTGKLNANAAVAGGQYPFFTCSRNIYEIDHFAFDCEAILLAGNNASGDFNVKHFKGKFNAYQRTYIIEIENSDLMNYRYLYFQMIKSLKVLKRNSVGANTKFLKLDMIKDLMISVPNVNEQIMIVSTLDRLKKETITLETLYQSKLADLGELRQSLLQKAFAGELT